MSWVMLANGRIVEWAGGGPLGDPANTGDALGGVIVGAGGPPGSLTEFPGSQAEIQQLALNVIAKATRLAAGDPVKFQQHFKDHRDLVMKAVDKHFPVSPAGEAAFLAELRSRVVARNLQLVGAGTLAKDQPIVYVFRGMVGKARLTLVMKPNGDFQTVIRAGEGLDARMRMLLRFDTPHPFMPEVGVPGGAG
jgi:hypothetical protein